MLGCERGSEGCEAAVAAVAAQGYGDRVHRAFDDHRGGAESEVAVELVALAEQRGLGGVEVLRSGFRVVAGGGVAAGDEAEDLAVGVGDGEGDAVAELVDQLAGGCDAGDAGGDHLCVGDAELSEVVDQVGPTCLRVSGLDEPVSGQVGAEPFD